ncbi:hypothetical protein ASPFODRAFT_715996 [Aspergillus luchuensis CBS 106.47]|uniref:Uncharacterized protein n=1 Tax=Aspergillus luchuensis (strain CBS 106.47) TaxID=1137211 RepID=A0A1M3SYI5_ASPLC|nr:hypothetical protein ASPFODRAFT_715996 [Aspergillus luchuensis CBS 106.47]
MKDHQQVQLERQLRPRSGQWKTTRTGGAALSRWTRGTPAGSELLAEMRRNTSWLRRWRKPRSAQEPECFVTNSTRSKSTASTELQCLMKTVTSEQELRRPLAKRTKLPSLRLHGSAEKRMRRPMGQWSFI